MPGLDSSEAQWALLSPSPARVRPRTLPAVAILPILGSLVGALEVLHVRGFTHSHETPCILCSLPGRRTGPGKVPGHTGGSPAS